MVREEAVFVFIITVWLATLLYFDPRLLALLAAKATIPGKLAVIAFVACLNIFWFFTIYYATVIVVSAWLRYKEPHEALLPPLKNHPPVALLYPTRNDFREDAVERLIQMDYPSFRVFILDDSTLDHFKKRIDDWASGHPGLVTVIRRPIHKGFKAGNLNYTLHQIAKDYPFFAVCDNDGIFPPNFINDLLPFFESDPTIAFVQTRQDANPEQPEYFAQAMSCAVAIHFRHYVRARRSYGFVMFYGHGALLKTSVWQEAGGFPEIVTEDLSYSTIVRTLGYRGVFTEKVICYEDYPPAYARLRRRTEKWIRGTAEFLKLYYPDFWKSPKVPWFEKIDLLVHATTHFTAIPTLIFLLILGTLLPANFDQFRYPTSFFFTPLLEGKTEFFYLSHVRHHLFWSLDFFIIMLLTVFLPTIPVVFDMIRKPKKMLRFLIIANFVYLGCLLAEAGSLIAFLITGKAYFPNTHDASEPKRDFVTSLFAGYDSNHLFVWIAELIVGALFTWLCWRTKNLWLAVPGIVLLFDPWLHWIGWDKRWVRGLTIIPFAIGAYIILVVTLHLLGSTCDWMFS